MSQPLKYLFQNDLQKCPVVKLGDTTEDQDKLTIKLLRHRFPQYNEYILWFRGNLYRL